MSITWNMWTPSFLNTHPAVAWRNATISHNRYAHGFLKGEYYKFGQSSDKRKFLKLENANPVGNFPIELQRRPHATFFKGETQMFSTAAAPSVSNRRQPKPPPRPPHDQGGPPVHNGNVEDRPDIQPDNKSKTKKN